MEFCVFIKHLLVLGFKAGRSQAVRVRPCPPLCFWATEGVLDQDGGSTLQRGAVTREDSGTYVCWAENRVGRVQATSFVHVQGRASLGDPHSL